MRTFSNSEPAAKVARPGNVRSMTMATARTVSNLAVYRIDLFPLRYTKFLRPAISILRPPRPVVFEGFGTGALVDAPVRGLIGHVRHDSLGILQVRHLAIGCGFFPCEQIVQKLPQ